ncbi:MAG TPA: lysylphosphatidylglycerol synthase domain-containing protein [Pyrinomonadaceae bacterium]
MDRETSPQRRKAQATADSEKNGGNGWLPVAGLAFGIAALVFIVYFVGLETILDPLGKIGWGFFWIVALNGIRHYLRAVNLYIAVPRAERSFNVRHALSARLAGETITTIAFTGPVLGDAAKAAMLKRKIPLEHSATAVIIDGIIYYVTSLVLILAGAIVVLSAYGTGLALNLILVGLVVFSIVVLSGIWLAVKKNVTPVSWLLKKLGERWYVPRSLRRKQDGIEEVENNVVQFHDQRPRAFFILVGIILLSHFLSVVEAYWAMRMLGLELTAASAFIIEALTKAVNFLFFLIPGTIGAYEGGSGLILTALGYTAGAGVALALVRRGAILFWTFVGGIILLWRGAKSSAQQLVEDD